MRKSISLLALITSILISAIANGQHIKGQIMLKKGQRLTETSISNVETKIELMGQGVTTKMETNISNSLEVKDIVDNHFVLSSTLKRVKLAGTVNGNEFNVDSDNSEDLGGPTGQNFKNIVGTPIEIKVDKEGKIAEGVEFISSEDMLNNLMVGPAGSLIKGANFQSLTNLSGKEIKVGDSWTENVKTEDMFSSETTYELMEYNDGLAKVNYTGTFNFSGEVPLENGESQMIEFKGAISGDMMVEVSTGIVKSRNIKSDLSTTIDVMGMQIPMTVKTVSRSTIEKQ